MFVENQLDFTKVSLEVCGNTHPRYMAAPDRIRLIDAVQRAKQKCFAFLLPSKQVALAKPKFGAEQNDPVKGRFAFVIHSIILSLSYDIIGTCTSANVWMVSSDSS